MGFYFIDVIIELVSGAMRGYGYSLPPALLMIVTICGIRIVWIYTIFAASPIFASIMMSYPVSWAVTAVLLAAIYMFYVRNLKLLQPLV